MSYKVTTEKKKFHGHTVSITRVAGVVKCLGGHNHNQVATIDACVHDTFDLPVPLPPYWQTYILRKRGKDYVLEYEHYLASQLLRRPQL